MSYTSARPDGPAAGRVAPALLQATGARRTRKPDRPRPPAVPRGSRDTDPDRSPDTPAERGARGRAWPRAAPGSVDVRGRAELEILRERQRRRDDDRHQQQDFRDEELHCVSRTRSASAAPSSVSAGTPARGPGSLRCSTRENSGRCMCARPADVDRPSSAEHRCVNMSMTRSSDASSSDANVSSSSTHGGACSTIRASASAQLLVLAEVAIPALGFIELGNQPAERRGVPVPARSGFLQIDRSCGGTRAPRAACPAADTACRAAR